MIGSSRVVELSNWEATVKKSRFPRESIVSLINKAEADGEVFKLVRKHGISEATL